MALNISSINPAALPKKIPINPAPQNRLEMMLKTQILKFKGIIICNNNVYNIRSLHFDYTYSHSNTESRYKTKVCLVEDFDLTIHIGTFQEFLMSIGHYHLRNINK